LAANNFIELRKADWRDFSDPVIGDVIKQLKNTPYDPWVWEFSLSQEAPDAAAEPRVAFTNEFNGEGTPIVLYVIGEAANEDKAGGTGAIGVTIFGIDSDGNPASQEVLMHATNATQVASTTLWKRYIGSMVTTAGSGLTNAGVITITNTGQTEVYGTIAAGENATIGARVYVPADYNAFIASFRAGVINPPHATAELLFGDGAIIAPVYLTNPKIDNVDSYWVDNISSMGNLNIIRQVIVGANTYYITFTHAAKAADANPTPVYNIKIIMYGTTNTLRGLGA
jgi:hypothetical protein